MDAPFLMKVALIGILGGLVLLLGPWGGMFWPGVACIVAGGMSLLTAVRAVLRREPEDEIAVELPAPEDEGDITDEELALLREAGEDRAPPGPVNDDRRYLGLEIALKVLLAVGTVAFLVLKIFVWSPEANEQRKRAEKQRELEKQLVKDALAGKTGPALQFLVTGDRSLLKAAKKKGVGALPVKKAGDPRPAPPRP
jgi:hypothetical protein